MALSPLLTSADTWEELSSWSLNHALDHDEIDTALRSSGKLTQPAGYPLDPLPPVSGILDWLMRHQLKHTEMNDALGLSSSDLTGFDMSTKEGVAAFIGANFSEHDDAHGSLFI